MVYAPIARAFAVNTSMIKADKIVAWWYCPRTGKAEKIGKFTNDGGERTFEPPMPGEAMDWVLVLDDAACRYPAPGSIYSPSKNSPSYKKIILLVSNLTDS